MSKKKKLQRFEIPLKRWYRGKGTEGSMLQRPGDHKMCCLGVYARVCGLKAKEIKGVTDPQGLCYHAMDPDIPERYQWTVSGGWDVTELMWINDDENISDVERKRQITKIFAKHGEDVIFRRPDGKTERAR